MSIMVALDGSNCYANIFTKQIVIVIVVKLYLFTLQLSLIGQ